MNKHSGTKRYQRAGAIGVLTTILGCGIALTGLAPAFAEDPVPAPATEAAPQPTAEALDELADTRLTTESPAAEIPELADITVSAPAAELGAEPAEQVVVLPPDMCPVPPTAVWVTDVTETGAVVHFTIDHAAADYDAVEVTAAGRVLDSFTPDGVTSEYSYPFDGFPPGSHIEAHVKVRCNGLPIPISRSAHFFLLGGNADLNGDMATTADAGAATTATGDTSGATASTGTTGTTDSATSTDATSTTDADAGGASATAAADAATGGTATASGTTTASGDGQPGNQAASGAAPASTSSVTSAKPNAGTEHGRGLAATGFELTLPLTAAGAMVAAAGLLLAVSARRRARTTR